MLRINDSSLESVSYRRFTDSQVDRLYQAVLEILEYIGIHFREPEAVEVFRRGGATVDGSLVRIPSWRVEWALRAAPKQLTLYDQAGRPAIRLHGRCAYFGNGSDLLYIVDHRTGDRREPSLQDVHDMIRVLDSLENIDFVMSGFLPRDVPVEKAERLQMQAMLQKTNKPIIYVTTDLRNTKDCVAMAETVAGGAEALRARPFAACYINITSPLHHNPEATQKLIWLSRNGLPFTYRPCRVTRGVTAPTTAAGYLATNSAGVLAGLVLSQLINEGTPFIGDCCTGGTFDMRHMVGQCAAPEIRGFNEDLLHFYGLPGFGVGGDTGAKLVDAQSGLEAALTLITSVQAGANLIHDVGYMDHAKTGSLVQMVVCDEIIEWVKVYLKPVVINDETLAMDAIQEASAGDGDFMASENTLRHFREDWYPDLLDRATYESWAAEGKLSLRDRARRYVDSVLERPPRSLLGDEQARSVQAIVDQL